MYSCDQFSINRMYFRDGAVCSLAPVEMGSLAVPGPLSGARDRGGEGPAAAPGPSVWPHCRRHGRERREVSLGLVAGGAGVGRPVVLGEKTLFMILVKDGQAAFSQDPHSRCRDH